MKDLIRSKPFIFLQHGVIKDDISGWLNKYNKNISMFVTTTKTGTTSILCWITFDTCKDTRIYVFRTARILTG